MSRLDRNYRLKKRVTLHAASVYLPTFQISDKMAKENYQAAEELLDKYNIGLKVWPPGGGKESQNSLNIKPYGSPIPHTKEAYRKLRTDVNAWIQGKCDDSSADATAERLDE